MPYFLILKFPKNTTVIFLVKVHKVFYKESHGNYDSISSKLSSNTKSL